MTPIPAVTLVALAVLTAAAWLRGAEYDEQYTLFLTAGLARPAWPETVFPAGLVAMAQGGHASLAGIARELRATDVHPPLYFWLVSFWRSVFGPSLFAARMLAVLCGTGSVALIGMIAQRRHASMAMLLTTGCYGFVYTAAIARGFAPAESLLLAGVALRQRGRNAAAGLALGAACCCNYLALFTAIAALAVTAPVRLRPVGLSNRSIDQMPIGRYREAAGSLAGMAPFLALDAWFFAAQHGSRPDQFPPFAPGPGLVRLISYQAAAIFGGLPLYADGAARIGVTGLIGALAITAMAAAVRSRGGGRRRRLWLATAASTPLGLLLLGAVFNNTPIELRYLSFGLPFLAILMAEAALPRVLRACLLLALALGIAGLLVSPRTMQPPAASAADAARLVSGAVVLVPYGNDGVGVVGAFAISAPPTLNILLVRPSDTPGIVAARLAGCDQVAIALLGMDRDSKAAIPVMRAAVAAWDWRPVAIRSNLEIYERNSGE